MVRGRSAFDLPGRIFEHFETNTLDGVGSAAAKSEDLLWCVQVGLEIGRSTHQLAGQCRQHKGLSAGSLRFRYCQRYCMC